LRLETYAALLRELLDSLYAQGFSRFLLVNGHGGNMPAGTLAREWAADHPDLPLLVDRASGSRRRPGYRRRVLACQLGRELPLDAAAGRRVANRAQADARRGRLPRRRAEAAARRDRRRQLRRALSARRRGDAPNLASGDRGSA